jgi:putative addiction module component (TIGR02574 family)
MTDTVAELAERGRLLPAEERVRLLDLLLESLDGEPSARELAWQHEIERRVVAHERGEGELHDADDVMAEAARIAP